MDYSCPMHPEVRQKEPGSCPKCGMELERIGGREKEKSPELQSMSYRFWISLPLTLSVFFLNFFSSDKPFQFAIAILTSAVVIYGGYPFFKKGAKSIWSRNLNMFTLIGSGVAITFLYSWAILLFFYQKSALYFEAAAMITSLTLLGQLLELKAREKTSLAIEELIELMPEKAHLVQKDGTEKDVPTDSLKIGDLLKVRPGEKIPTDGEILEGKSYIDESMISGEPTPSKKEIGDFVTGATINGNGSLLMKATRVGKETLFSKIIDMVLNAKKSKAPTQKLVDTVSSYFVPAVIASAILTFLGWYILGKNFEFAIINSISVIIIACPCALGLATPISMTVGIGLGAKQGILIKNGEALENIAKVNVVVIDKTGTITEGHPSLQKIIPIEIAENELLQKAASLEKESEHPIAKALLKLVREKEMPLLPVQDFEAVQGKGIRGKVNGEEVVIGNRKIFEEYKIEIPPELKQQQNTTFFVSIKGKISGTFVIEDKIRETSKDAVAALQEKGIFILMATGDRKEVAESVAKQVGIDKVYSEILPEEKYKIVEDLKKEGKFVAVAGDGINDAPALAKADIGIAMGTGTDVAIESAAVALVKGDLKGISKARVLSGATIKNIKQNLWLAFLYNSLGIPIAAGALYPFFGISLKPIIASVAMSLSSLSVVLNALRLKKTDLWH